MGKAVNGDKVIWGLFNSDDSSTNKIKPHLLFTTSRYHQSRNKLNFINISIINKHLGRIYKNLIIPFYQSTDYYKA